jgi:hypothetical protein
VAFLAEIRDFVLRNRFVVLFGSLLLFMVSLPLADLRPPSADVDTPHVIEGFLFLAVLAAAAISVAKTTTGKVLALVVGLPAMILRLLHGHGGHFEVAGYLVAMAFLTYIMVSILRFVFSHVVVTSDTLFAALCVFVLMAVVWSLAYSTCAALDSTSFAFTLSPERPRPSLRIARGGALPVIYFSLSTLTTLGYGDIVPTSSVTRMLACTEAVLGQLYLTVLVARLVGLYAAPVRLARPGADGTVDQGTGHPPRMPTSAGQEEQESNQNVDGQQNQGGVDGVTEE